MKKLYTLATVISAFAPTLLTAQNATPVTPTPASAQQIQLLNQSLQKRLPKQQACMEVKQNVVKLVLWDCGIEDNDTVSINLNGQWVLHNFRLTNAKQEIEVTLAPGENQLSLLANNLGDIPDNTAAMAINENGKEQKATLSSNLQTNGTMRLLVTGNNPAAQLLTGCPKDVQVYMDDENQQVRANPDLANPKFGFLYGGVKKYATEPARTLEMQGCTNVSDSVVTLYFWDSGVEDNDTISINLNGVWVVEKLRLTKQHQAIPVKLQPGSNYIVMYAHNLGDLPNNTSGVGVEYKFGKQELGTLYSDMNTSGTFRFNCTAGASPDMASQPCIKTQNNTARHQTDPEMQYLNKQQAGTQQQPTQYTPQSQPNATIGTGTRVGVGVITVPQPRGNTGNNNGNTGNTPRQPRNPTGNNPAPTRTPRPQH